MHPVPPRQDPAPGPFEYRFTRSLSNIRLARHALAGWLELQPGVDADAIDDLLVVCSELVTNAVLHAPGPEASATAIALRAETNGDSVVLEVEDPGGGFSWPVAHVMSDVRESEEHGRGLFIVEALTDRLGVVQGHGEDSGTVVRCVKFGVLGHHRASETVDDHALSARFRAEDERSRSH